MRRRVFLRRAALAAAGAAAGAAAYKGCRLDPRDLRAERVRVPCPGIARGEVRALVLSDVDWPRSRAVWERIPALARSFAPDFLLVAGDFLDRASTIGDAAIARAAGDWLASVVPGVPVLVSPGESESPARERLAAAWEGRAEILANEVRRFEVRGEAVELFVADAKTDPAVWGLVRAGGRGEARTQGRKPASTLRWNAPPGLGSFELSFALHLDAPRTSLEIRLLDGWRLRCRPGRRAFRLQRGFRSDAPLEGRDAAGFAPPLRVACRARVRVEGSDGGCRLRARFWIEGDREPAGWPIDVVDRDPARPLGAPVTFAARSGPAGIADVRVVDRDGVVRLEERFDDLDDFRERWTQNSRLLAWSRSPGEAPTRIVLAHHPDVALALAEGALPRPDLVVAGHTHGGQIRLPLLGPLLTDTRLGRRYDRGVFDVEGTRLFVTAGVGTSILPVRWEVPPDVGLLTLVPGRRDEPATLLDSAAPEASP